MKKEIYFFIPLNYIIIGYDGDFEFQFVNFEKFVLERFFRTLNNRLICILSEKFLYFNDDISFTKPICLSDFWTPDHGYKEMTLIL